MKRSEMVDHLKTELYKMYMGSRFDRDGFTVCANEILKKIESKDMLPINVSNLDKMTLYTLLMLDEIKVFDWEPED